MDGRCGVVPPPTDSRRLAALPPRADAIVDERPVGDPPPAPPASSSEPMLSVRRMSVGRKDTPLLIEGEEYGLASSLRRPPSL